MALFKYCAFDGSGNCKNGIITSNSENEARDKILAMGLFPRSISEDSHRALPCLGDEDMINFFHMLSQLIKAGLALYDALVVIEENYKDTRLFIIFSLIADSVKSGKDLSLSMSMLNGIFPKICTAIIFASENSGNLVAGLDRICEIFKKRAVVRKKVISALIYPCILMSVAFLVIMIMNVIVVPTIAPMLEGKPVGLVTKAVLMSSHVLTSIPIYALCMLSIGFIGLLFLFRRGVYMIVKKAVLSLPFFTQIVIYNSVYGFCYTLGSLLLCGVEMISALEIARESVFIEDMKKLVDNIIVNVEHGGSISEMLKEPYFPSTVKRIIKIGESGSDLSAVLLNLGDYYSKEVDERVDRMSSVIQPLIIVFMGLVVGLIVMGVLFPLTDLSSVTGF